MLGGVRDLKLSKDLILLIAVYWCLLRVHWPDSADIFKHRKSKITTPGTRSPDHNHLLKKSFSSRDDGMTFVRLVFFTITVNRGVTSART